MSDYGLLSDLITGYLPAVTNDVDKAAFAMMITRASRAIDTRTRRQANAFTPAPDAPTPQVFYGTDSAVLLLPDFVPGSITTVTAPQNFAPAGFAEWQRRDETAGAYRRGLHTSTSDGILTAREVWKGGVPFTVTARWGFAATPAEITEAVYQLVRAWWLQQPGNLSAPVGDMKPWQIERGFPKMVDELIAPYVLPDAIAEEEGGEIERGELINSDFNPTRDPFRPGGGGRF